MSDKIEISEYAVLAKAIMLELHEYVVLPAVIERSAAIVDVTPRSLFNTSMSDKAVREYLASVCKTVARSVGDTP